MHIPHVPVLLHEVVENFKDIDGYFIDATLGYGGHSEALLQANPNIKILGIDQDEEAIAFSKERLAPYSERVKIFKGDFATVTKDLLRTYSIKGLLADIGVSSLQLDKKERGFSLQSDNLDMRMDKSRSLRAYDVVNYYDQKELERIFKHYGEHPKAKKIAQLIVQNRPIASAKELADLIASHLPKFGKIHPATTIFQAIRIEVNQELEQLERLLKNLQEARPNGARVGVVTFHSLEDRIVKNYFKRWAKKCICPPQAMRCECGGTNEVGTIVTKKPIVASKEEIERNPRSRSAKLRIFQFKEAK